MARIAGFDPAWQTQIARYQAAANNYQGATYSLDKALSGQPDFLPAQVLLTELDISSGELAKAEQRAKAILNRGADKAVGYRLLGEVAMARKKYPEAIERFRAALASEPSTDGALLVFRAYAQSGNVKAGNEFLESWVRAHPVDRVARRALAEGYLRAGNLGEARARYETVLKEEGDDALLLNNLANILLLQKDPKAIAYAERAFQLAPTNASLQDTLGWALVQAGEIEQGLRHLRDARLRQPQDPEIRYHLAVALARAGRATEARQELTEALRGGNDFAGAGEARRLLAELGSR